MRQYLCKVCRTRIDKNGELFLSFLGYIKCSVCNQSYHYSLLIVADL